MSGRRPASGSGCTSCCSPACVRRARSSGRGRSPTPVTCRRKRGLRDGPEPGRRGQKRAPSTTSSSTRRDPARLGAHRRQPPRRHPADPAARPRAAGRAAWSAGRAADPTRVIADRGYDYDSHRRQLRQRGIRPEIARRKTEHGSGLGRYRWVVERTFAWLHQFKRLLVRYDRRADIHEAFLALGCCLVCYRRLNEPHCERSS